MYLYLCVSFFVSLSVCLCASSPIWVWALGCSHNGAFDDRLVLVLGAVTGDWKTYRFLKAYASLAHQRFEFINTLCATVCVCVCVCECVSARCSYGSLVSVAYSGHAAVRIALICSNFLKYLAYAYTRTHIYTDDARLCVRADGIFPKTEVSAIINTDGIRIMYIYQ